MPNSTGKRAARVRRGAPCGNRNALKHGKYTRERRALYAEIRDHIREGRALTAAISVYFWQEGQ